MVAYKVKVELAIISHLRMFRPELEICASVSEHFGEENWTVCHKLTQRISLTGCS